MLSFLFLWEADRSEEPQTINLFLLLSQFMSAIDKPSAGVLLNLVPKPWIYCPLRIVSFFLNSNPFISGKDR